MPARKTTLVLAAFLAACAERPSLTEVHGSVATASSAPTAVDFTTVGASTFTVPEGVTSLSVVAVGGGAGGSISFTGGSGAIVTAMVPVTPGQVLDVFVGGGSAGNNFNIGGGGSSGITAGGCSTRHRRRRRWCGSRS